VIATGVLGHMPTPLCICSIVCRAAHAQRKRQEKKLGAYFDRCGFASTTTDDLQKFLKVLESNPGFLVIRDKVAKWSAAP
jgi:hypothetical protein